MTSRSLRPNGRKLGVAALAASLGLAGLGLAGAAPVSAAEVETVTDDCGRLAGQTRFGTAGAVADAYDASSDTDHAIIANGFNFPDALAASGLARELDAPVLLVNQDSVPLETRSALEDLGIANVTIVGGTAAVSQGVEDALEEDYTVTREAGTDRYLTAEEIAAAVGTAGELDGLTTAIIATGNNYPDALAGGPIAYHGDGTNPFPILLTNGAEVPQATQDALETAGIEQVIILGGTDAVPTAAETELETITGNDAIRLAGTTREGTAQEVADFAVAELGFAPDAVLLADGRVRFPSPDALSGGPLGGLVEAPILLVNPGMPAQTQEFIEDNAAAIDQAIALGGTAAISEDILEAGCDAAGIGAAPASATSLPELVSAQILGTTTTGQATTTNPAGTKVRYTFDEAVTGAVAPVPGSFLVYTSAGVPTTAAGGTAIVESGGNTVVVNFPTLNTTASAANLTVATVDQGAVMDNQGQTNPEGDAAIGTARTDTAGAAGVTAAPDLVSVSGFRATASATQTAVDFTFDEVAYVVNATGFRLIRTNGAELTCTGPAVGTASPSAGGPASGEAVAGGNGTTTITVLCTNPAGVTVNPATDIARGTVDVDTVRDGGATAVPATDNNNPLQAADVSNGGNTTTTPDLVSAELRPGATVADADRVLYTFDEPVAVAITTPANFNVYNAQGDETAYNAAAAGASIQRNPDNATQVLVTYGTGNTAVDTAVGASVEDGAVTGSSGAAQPNQQDEVGVSNPSSVNITPGRTTGPDLTGVALEVSGTNPFTGAPNAYRAVFTFDEAVATATASEFKLWTADGTRLDTTNCVVGTAANSGPTTVRCDGFSGVRASDGGTVAGPAVAGATLGTVDNAAVTAADGGPQNPEGAEFLTRPAA